MTTHEELAQLIQRMEDAGWHRLNGNTWGRAVDVSKTTWWKLTTSYVMHEASLTLARVDNLTAKVTPNRSYRGAHPLSWAGNLPGVKVGSNFGK